MAASLFYLAIHNQRDAAGLIVFDDEVREYDTAVDAAGAAASAAGGAGAGGAAGADGLCEADEAFQELLRRRGIVIVISDFYEEPEVIVKAIEPLRFHGNEVVLFHVLDPKEIRAGVEGAGGAGGSGDGAAAGGDSGVYEE